MGTFSLRVIVYFIVLVRIINRQVSEKSRFGLEPGRNLGTETTRRQNNSSTHFLDNSTDRKTTRRHFLRQFVDIFVQRKSEVAPWLVAGQLGLKSTSTSTFMVYTLSVTLDCYSAGVAT